ncbi:hypothetical protein [Mycobacterium sp. D16R24]|uniref:hypothetical protein n=1 Tax=Mycobacterium sp. D16R24 TaxID=1855656 RepID=UPI000992577C|nr:hypothetical protein [Mycobacterium sp. D16R24]
MSVRLGPLEWVDGSWDGPGVVIRHEEVGTLARSEIDELPNGGETALWVDRSAAGQRLHVDAENGSWTYSLALETMDDSAGQPYEYYRLELIQAQPA